MTIVALFLDATSVLGHGLPMILLNGIAQMPSAVVHLVERMAEMMADLVMITPMVATVLLSETMTVHLFPAALSAIGLGLPMTQHSGIAQMPSADVSPITTTMVVPQTITSLVVIARL